MGGRESSGKSVGQDKKGLNMNNIKRGRKQSLPNRNGGQMVGEIVDFLFFLATLGALNPFH